MQHSVLHDALARASELISGCVLFWLGTVSAWFLKGNRAEFLTWWSPAVRFLICVSFWLVLSSKESLSQEKWSTFRGGIEGEQPSFGQSQVATESSEASTQYRRFPGLVELQQRRDTEHPINPSEKKGASGRGFWRMPRSSLGFIRKENSRKASHACFTRSFIIICLLVEWGL